MQHDGVQMPTRNIINAMSCQMPTVILNKADKKESTKMHTDFYSIKDYQHYLKLLQECFLPLQQQQSNATNCRHLYCSNQLRVHRPA